MIENNATMMRLHSRWLQNIDPCEPGIMKIIDAGYFNLSFIIALDVTRFSNALAYTYCDNTTPACHNI